MALNLAVAVAGEPVANDSIVIGLGDLPGITENELNQDTRIIESKFIYSYLNKLYQYVSLPPAGSTGYMGLTATKAAPIGAGNDLLNQNFSATFVYYANLGNNQIETFESQARGGQPSNYSVTEAFRTLQPVLAGDNAPVNGIAIPSITAAFGSILGMEFNPFAIVDRRLALGSLTASIILSAERRGAGSSSAITAANRGNPVTFNIPVNFFTGNNPLTNLDAVSVQKIAAFSITLGATIQLKLNQMSQTFDVHVVDTEGNVLEPPAEPEPAQNEGGGGANQAAPLGPQLE